MIVKISPESHLIAPLKNLKEKELKRQFAVSLRHRWVVISNFQLFNQQANVTMAHERRRMRQSKSTKLVCTMADKFWRKSTFHTACDVLNMCVKKCNDDEWLLNENFMRWDFFNYMSLLLSIACHTGWLGWMIYNIMLVAGNIEAT